MGAIISMWLYHLVLLFPLAGVVFGLSHGDVVTMASAAVNNIGGAITNIELPK